MSPADAMARAAAAGVRLHLSDDGKVRMQADAPPPADVLADLRRWREDVARILSERRLLAAAEAQSPGVDDASAQPAPEEDHRAAVSGYLMAGLQRPPSWSTPTPPPPGAFCSCCGRFTKQGGRWWRSTAGADGWCCTTCHPPPPGLAVVEVAT